MNLIRAEALRFETKLKSIMNHQQRSVSRLKACSHKQTTALQSAGLYDGQVLIDDDR